jgi:hypothetical protein
MMSETLHTHWPGCWEDPAHALCARTQARAATEYITKLERDLAAAVERAERAEAALITARNAMGDALSGWRYIRGTHGDLYGVGWDRVEQKLDAALAAKETPDA